MLWLLLLSIKLLQLLLLLFFLGLVTKFTPSPRIQLICQSTCQSNESGKACCKASEYAFIVYTSRWVAAKSMWRKGLQQQQLIARNKWCLQSLAEKRSQRPWSSSFRRLTKCPHSDKHLHSHSVAAVTPATTYIQAHRYTSPTAQLNYSVLFVSLFSNGSPLGRLLRRSECNVSLKAICAETRSKTPSC